jgi:hypothetical protein
VPDVNVPAVALIALIIASIAGLGVGALGAWALDASPQAIRERKAHRAFRCPCGHDFVFHARDKVRPCQRKNYDGACGCQGYRGEIPPATLAELLDGPS